MTRVRWTPDAADDFAAIIERIREDNPSAALRVARTIYTAVAELRSFPNRGRKGLAPDTRELVFRHGRSSSYMRSSTPSSTSFASAMLLRTGRSRLGATSVYNGFNAPI